MALQRKIIQIVSGTVPDTPDYYGPLFLFALCDDGTMWRLEVEDDLDKSEQDWVLLDNATILLTNFNDDGGPHKMAMAERGSAQLRAAQEESHAEATNGQDAEGEGKARTEAG